MVVIADDLTGAADCAAACAARGISATVLLHSRRDEDSDAWWPESEIISIDADTRHLSNEQAAETTTELVQLCQRRGAQGSGCLLFKKLDSTLRGNIAAELGAILRTRRMAREAEKPSIVMAPALPAQGRTTVGGRQMVRGRPLEETDIWAGETRAPQSEISALLAEGGLSCRVIDAATVRSGLSGLQGVMVRLADEADVVVCDAETDDDLRTIAEVSMALGERTVWAGSAGLARYLPAAAGMLSEFDDKLHMNFPAGPTLFVVGSAATISREQVSILAAIPEVATMRVTPALLADSPAASTQIVKALQSRRDVLVVLEGSPSGESRLVTRALSRMVAPCAPFIGGLVATGGETARAILDDLGIRRLRMLGEVEPGLAFSAIDGWTRQLPVLTKAGGFGLPETLVRCREFLRRLERASAKVEEHSSFVSRES